MALYKDGNPVSGLNSIPRLTLAQYNALNVKPEFWVRTDAPESYKKLSADQVSYDSNNTVKDMLDELDDEITDVNKWTSLGDITSGGAGVDVSQYNTICILPKMQGWATQNPQFIPKLLNTASSVAVYVNATYYFSFRINISPSGVLSIDNEALSGWTTCIYAIYAQ